MWKYLVRWNHLAQSKIPRTVLLYSMFCADIPVRLVRPLEIRKAEYLSMIFMTISQVTYWGSLQINWLSLWVIFWTIIQQWGFPSNLKLAISTNCCLKKWRTTYPLALPSLSKALLQCVRIIEFFYSEKLITTWYVHWDSNMWFHKPNSCWRAVSCL